VRLARVLHQSDAEPRRKSLQSAHVCHLAIEVDWEHRSRPLADGGLAGVDVDVVVRLGDVDDDGGGTGLGHRLEGGGERLRRDDHLVRRGEFEGQQRQP